MKNAKCRILRAVRSLLHSKNWRLALSLCLLLIGAAGCATTESDMTNTAERPWNSPRGWENGIPLGLTEGR